MNDAPLRHCLDGTLEAMNHVGPQIAILVLSQANRRSGPRPQRPNPPVRVFPVSFRYQRGRGLEYYSRRRREKHRYWFSQRLAWLPPR